MEAMNFTGVTKCRNYWMVGLPIISIMGILLEAIFSSQLLGHIERGLPYGFQVEHSARALAFILIVLTGLGPVLLALEVAPDERCREIIRYEMASAAVITMVVGIAQLCRGPVSFGLLEHHGHPFFGYAFTTFALLCLDLESKPTRAHY